MKVMLVDDSSTMRRIQKKVLTTLGFTDVVEAADGLSAQVKLESDGLTFLKGIREGGITTPVIMVTTEAQKENVVKALQAGAQSYVIKPFTPDVLEKRIRDVVSKAQAAQA